MRSWLDAALTGAGFHEHGFESIHLDELVDDYVEADAVEAGFRALDDLVRCYRDRAGELMASLVVVLGHDDRSACGRRCPVTFLPRRSCRDVPAAWEHFTPPELYLQTRKPDFAPYIVEEYRSLSLKEPSWHLTGFTTVTTGVTRRGRRSNSPEWSTLSTTRRPDQFVRPWRPRS